MAARAAGETAIAPVASRYRRREPERTLLHATVRAHWKTFLAEVEEGCGGGGSLPRFVVGEFERYLACGILANGFARVRCAACGDELLVALSCKGRGFCPSCTTRRMHDTAKGEAGRRGPSPLRSRESGANSKRTGKRALLPRSGLSCTPPPPSRGAKGWHGWSRRRWPASQPLGRKGAGKVRNPAGARELGGPDRVDAEDVEVVGFALEGGEEKLARGVGSGRERLVLERDAGVVAAEAVEQGGERRRVAEERLVLEHDADRPARLRRRRACARARVKERAGREGGKSRKSPGRAPRHGVPISLLSSDPAHTCSWTGRPSREAHLASASPTR
jgi:hypothetical protein